MARITLDTEQRSKYKRQWKKNLKAVGDNAQYIEQNMVAIANELKKNDPDTKYLHSKVRNIGDWLHEIDLAKERESRRRKICKVM